MITDTKIICVGSSLVGAAISEHDSDSRAKVWRKLLGKPTDAEVRAENSAQARFMIERGNKLEPHAVSAVEAHLGILFDCTGDAQYTGFLDRLRSTPDGIWKDTCCEVKVLSPHGKWQYPKPQHVAQCQAHLAVHELEYCYFARFDTDKPLLLWQISRSDDYIEEMLARLDDFLEFVDKDVKPSRAGFKEMPPVKIWKMP